MTPKHTNLFTPVFHCNLRNLLLGTFLLAWLPAAHSALPDPNLGSDSDIATAGFYRLSWKGDKVTAIQLQEAVTPQFKHATLARVMRGVQGGSGERP